MRRILRPDISGHVTFSDDIRQEIDGKHTIVGAYSGEMIFPIALPVVLPKLGFTIALKLNSEWNADYKFQIVLPGQSDENSFFTIDPNGEQLKQSATNKWLDPEEDKRFTLHVNAVLSPVEIKQEGFVEVRATKDDEYYRVGRLKISVRRPETI